MRFPWMIVLIPSISFSMGVILALHDHVDFAEFIFENTGNDVWVIDNAGLFNFTVESISVDHERIIVMVSGRGRGYKGNLIVDVNGETLNLSDTLKRLSDSRAEYTFILMLHGKEENDAYSARFTLGNTYPPDNVSVILLWGKGSVEATLRGLYGMADSNGDGRISGDELLDFVKGKVDFVKVRGKVDFDVESILPKLKARLVEVFGEIPKSEYDSLVREVYKGPDADVRILKELLEGEVIGGVRSGNPAGIELNFEVFSFGGEGKDRFYSIVRDGDGYVAVGYTESQDLPCESHGKSDVWLVFLDLNLKIEKMVCLGGSGDDKGYKIVKIADGFLITGMTSSPDGDVTGWKGGKDAWIVKVDESGYIVWERTIGGSGDELSYDVLEVEGGFLIAGWTTSHDHDFSYTLGKSDYFVVFIDDNGEILWTRTFGTVGREGEGTLSPRLIEMGSNYRLIGWTDSETLMVDFDIVGVPHGRHLLKGLRIRDALKLGEKAFAVGEVGRGSVFGFLEDADFEETFRLVGSGYDRFFTLFKTGGYVTAVGWTNSVERKGFHLGKLGVRPDGAIALFDDSGDLVFLKLVGGTGGDVLFYGTDNLIVGWTYSVDWNAKSVGSSDGLIVKIHMR